MDGLFLGEILFGEYFGEVGGFVFWGGVSVNDIFIFWFWVK